MHYKYEYQKFVEKHHFHVKTNQIQRCFKGDNFYYPPVGKIKFPQSNSATCRLFLPMVKALKIISTRGSIDTNHSAMRFLKKPMNDYK